MFAVGSNIVTPLGASKITAVVNDDCYRVTGPCGLTAVFTRKQILAAQNSTTLFTVQSPSVMIIDAFLTTVEDYSDRILLPKMKEYFEEYLHATISDWLNPSNGKFCQSLESLEKKDVYAAIFFEDSDIPLELMSDSDTNTIGVSKNRCVVWKSDLTIISSPSVRMQVFAFNLE